MKFVKVIIKKEIANGGFKHIKPQGYDAQKIAVEAYEHKGNRAKVHGTEFLYGIAADDFPLVPGEIIELSETAYNAAVDKIDADALKLTAEKEVARAAAIAEAEAAASA